MEINFKELTGIETALNRIAAALEGLSAPKAPAVHPAELAPTEPPKPVEKPAEQPEPKKAEPAPAKKKKPAADNQGDELTEAFMRKFAAEAVKKVAGKAPARKGGVAQAIKGVTDGVTKFADIDPALYRPIKEAIEKLLAEVEA